MAPGFATEQLPPLISQYVGAAQDNTYTRLSGSSPPTGDPRLDSLSDIAAATTSTMTATEKQKPNSGASVPDITANGDQLESQAAWLKERKIDVDGRIQLTKLSHVRYQHPNLDEISQFLSGASSRTTFSSREKQTNPTE
jgi:hypothetical protein